MFIVSNLVGSSIQITTLPLPVLSTLQASGLVFNSICATLILGEPFTRWSLVGTLLVCAGAVLIATFGAIGEPAHSLDQLLALLGRQQFIIWMIGTAIVVVAVIIGTKVVRWMNPRTHHTPRMRLLRGMAYGGISGILSAHSLLVAKSAVELLVRTIVDRHNQFNRWQSWIILLALLALALSQLYYLHKGLKLCSTSILYPFVFCVYNIIAILDGLIYFRQTSRLSLLHALLVRTFNSFSLSLNAMEAAIILSRCANPQKIALGTLILLGGVLALSWRLHDPTTRPTVPQTPLAPGMGFIDSENDTESSSPLLPSHDDEEALNAKRNGSLSSPLLADVKTPTTKTDNEFLSPHPRSRKRAMTETEEILEELEDDTLTELFSPSPFSHRRRSSARSTPSKARRQSTDDRQPADDEATALLGRTGTGRSYRDRRRRRRSEPSVMGSGRRRRSGDGSQDALGGWWKMGWWRSRDGKGKDADDGGGNDHT